MTSKQMIPTWPVRTGQVERGPFRRITLTVREAHALAEWLAETVVIPAKRRAFIVGLHVGVVIGQVVAAFVWFVVWP